MKLNEILQITEAAIPSWHEPKKLSDEEIITWCEKNAMSFLKNRVSIYRGMRPQVDGLYDTSTFNRKAIHIPNTANLWLSNHPDWAEFPKRTKSVFGSNDVSIARLYGKTIHFLIPADNVEIGICPDTDLWDSFTLPDDYTIHTFLGFLEYIDVDCTTWDSLVKTSKNINRNHMSIRSDISDNAYYSDILTSWFDKYNVDSVYELLGKVFSPTRFKHVTANTRLTTSPREFWMSGHILQLSNQRISESDKLVDFFEKYIDFDAAVPDY